MTRGHFETTIDEDGKTRLRERYVVSAPLAGLLGRVTLREGDVVEGLVVLAAEKELVYPQTAVKDGLSVKVRKV